MENRTKTAHTCSLISVLNTGKQKLFSKMIFAKHGYKLFIKNSNQTGSNVVFSLVLLLRAHLLGCI